MKLSSIFISIFAIFASMAASALFALLFIGESRAAGTGFWVYYGVCVGLATAAYIVAFISLQKGK